MPVVDGPTDEPRHACKKYMEANGIKPKLLKKKQFDKLARKKQFKSGPMVDTFGDAYGEPYNPYRQAFGILKDGKGVFCELGE